MSSMNTFNPKDIKDQYEWNRTAHGIMDSIRFTAKDFELKPLEVAEVLGLSEYFISQNNSWS